MAPQIKPLQGRERAPGWQTGGLWGGSVPHPAPQVPPQQGWVGSEPGSQGMELLHPLGTPGTHPEGLWGLTSH